MPLRNAVDFISEILGTVLQISGALLLVIGIFLVIVEAIDGIAFALGDLGVVSITMSIILLLAGTLLAKSAKARLEDELIRSSPVPTGPFLLGTEVEPTIRNVKDVNLPFLRLRKPSWSLLL